MINCSGLTDLAIERHNIWAHSLVTMSIYWGWRREGCVSWEFFLCQGFPLEKREDFVIYQIVFNYTLSTVQGVKPLLFFIYAWLIYICAWPLPWCKWMKSYSKLSCGGWIAVIIKIGGCHSVSQVTCLNVCQGMKPLSHLKKSLWEVSSNWLEKCETIIKFE